MYLVLEMSKQVIKYKVSAGSMHAVLYMYDRDH